MKDVFYFFSKALFVLKIFKCLDLNLPLFFSLLAIALDKKKVWHWKFVHWQTIIKRNIYHTEKSYRKCAAKACPWAYFILVNNTKQLLSARNLSKKFIRKNYKKIIKNKSGLELVTSRSSGYKTRSQ